MHILIAPDSFKGSLSAHEAVSAISEAIREILPAATLMPHPLSDGGEGTAALLGSALGAKALEILVADEQRRTIRAPFWVLASATQVTHSVILDSASCLGAQLFREDAEPVDRRSSSALGTLVKEALLLHPEHLLLGLGGTATNDAGFGFACALGFRVFDEQGRRLEPLMLRRRPMPELLRATKHIEAPLEIMPHNRSNINALCDVSNPLFGESGSTAVYGPQKGVRMDQVKIFEAAIRHFTEIVRRDVADVNPDLPGSGAGGGLGFALHSFLSASLHPGSDYMLHATGFHARCAQADLVITGEGTIDGQTRQGKVVAAVAKICKKLDKPCIAFAGAIRGDDVQFATELGLRAALCITPADQSHDMAVQNARRNLHNAVVSYFRTAS